MTKQYFIDSAYDYEDTSSALMSKMYDNVSMELSSMICVFDRGDTEESYDHYKNALAEMKQVSFKEAESITVKPTTFNWAHHHE